MCPTTRGVVAAPFAVPFATGTGGGVAEVAGEGSDEAGGDGGGDDGAAGDEVGGFGSVKRIAACCGFRSAGVGARQQHAEHVPPVIPCATASTAWCTSSGAAAVRIASPAATRPSSSPAALDHGILTSGSRWGVRHGSQKKTFQ